MQGFRYEQRKKKRINKILNVAISIVTILILFFAYQIIFDNDSSEEAMTEEVEEAIDSDSSRDTSDVSQEVPITTEDTEEENIEEEGSNEEQEEDELADEELEPVPDGEWQPVGTEQTEFSPNFSSGSTNRNEMEKALRYATGLDHNMTVWRIENGGSETRARGVVSGEHNHNQPYEVYIEWIDGEGWMPVERNQLSSNPYR
ncbi:YrrS family protein [Halalkalibacter krulwichiae]|uniref:DUF1510 domain-containing protein n=1 Tax=Halalkalibacter krulwichiae TaxID=199441 RepID=A0A1X9M997_9BACI|nr:YrrS family protein [Halalkalibacter krulwichiae]ARK29254.1 hypothetical protein BkAM31D_04950 [Halalkalibacter krulwichiae]